VTAATRWIGGRRPSRRVLSVAGVPAGDRFARWWEEVSAMTAAVYATSPHREEFWGEMVSLDLGPMRLSRLRCAPFVVSRTAALIGRGDTDQYHLFLLLGGGAELRQAGREASLGPGDLVLYDTTRVYRVWTDAGCPADGVLLQLPRDLLPLRAAQVERVLCTSMSGREGIGAVLTAVLGQVAARTDELSAAQAAHVCTALVDLVVGLVGRYLDEAADDPTVADAPDAVDAGLLLRVQGFVERHLEDPDLSPAALAAAHHVSLSYLQKLFRRHDATVSGWIRERRLERCRQLLAEPRLANRPAYVIAMSCGFSAPAHFSRVFREAYGMPPAAWRRTALQGRSRHRGGAETGVES
jgi:AraC-like DNA-binding protein